MEENDRETFAWLVGDHIESASYKADSATWVVAFRSGAVLSIGSMWRLIEDGTICSTSLDHGHRFGLAKEFDGVMALREMGQHAIENVRVRAETGDLSIDLGPMFELQVISTSAGYEPWQLTHPALGMWVASSGKLHSFKNGKSSNEE